MLASEVVNIEARKENCMQNPIQIAPFVASKVFLCITHRYMYSAYCVRIIRTVKPATQQREMASKLAPCPRNALILVVGLAHSVEPEETFDGDDIFVRYGVAVKGIWCGQLVDSKESKDVIHALEDVSIRIPV